MDGNVIALSEPLLGYALSVRAERLDDGLSVLLTGGCRTHIGAVSVAEPGTPPETMTFPGHKDQLVSEPWAKALAEHTGVRTAVICGIHYDGATGEDIASILRVTGALLSRLLEELAP